MKASTFKKLFVLAFFLLVILVLYASKSIAEPVFFSIALAYMLNPLVRFMVEKGINIRLAVVISLLVLFVGAFLTIFYVTPGLLKDMLGILNNLNNYNDVTGNYLNSIGYEDWPPYLKNVLDNSITKVQYALIGYLNSFFNDIIDFSMELPTYILTPVFVYYFLIDRDYFLGIIKSFIPIKLRGKSVELGHEIDDVIGSFIKSQVILSIVIAVFTFIALFAMKIKYPLIIAIINGITNIIPYFGPVIGFLPAFMAALMESVDKAIMVAVVFFIIQQLESSILAPKLMSDSIGIHPVIIMVVLLLGGKFFGGWGLILSVPVAGAIRVTYKYVIKNLY